MKNAFRILAALIGLTVILSSCGKEETTGQEPPVPPIEGDLAVSLTLTDPSGGPPTPRDSLISEVSVVNRGDGVAHEVVIVDSLIPGFAFLRAESDPEARIAVDEAVRMDSLSLSPGDSAVLRVSMEVPERFPDGFRISSRARVTYDHDSLSATPRELVLSDDPHTGTPEDRTVATVENEGMDFFLLAPGVVGVQLAGEFNGWDWQRADYAMFPDEERRTWGLTLADVKGAEQYKFVIPNASEGDWVGDPRAVRLADDGYGSYNAVAGVPLPDPVDPLPGGIDPTRLVIYELLTYDFSATGDLAGLAAGLTGGIQNLADLGINAVELLPMTAAYRSGFNWGYNPGFYFAVDPDYGTPEEFAGFVETCHDHGIAVILDMVFNHCDGGAPLAQLDRLGTGGVFLNPEQDDVFAMPQLNWFTTEMREFFLDCALFWIEQYGVDGFRMDLVDWRDYEGYQWWRNQIKALHPEFFLIGEDFSLPPWNSVTVSGMDAQWGGQHTDAWGGVANNFQQVVMAILQEDYYQPRWGVNPPGLGCFETDCNPMWALANVLEWTPGYPTFHNEIKYIVSHDERRLVYEVEHSDELEARSMGARKAKLGAATLLTAVGVPMIYMGEEIGEDDPVGQDPAPNKVDWDEGDPSIRSYYRSLIELRLSHPTLAGGGIDFHCPSWGTESGTCQVNKTICYWRYLGSPAQADIVVASNYDHASHDFDVPFPSSGTWYLLDPELGSAAAVEIESGAYAMTLTASTAYIFLKDVQYLP